MVLFNKTLIRDILLKFSRLPTGYDNDKSNYSSLINRQPPRSQDVDTKNIPFLPTGSAVAVKKEDRAL